MYYTKPHFYHRTMIANTPPSSSLSWYDYAIFVGTLVLSSLIGIYYGCFGSRQSTINEYLMGGKTMKIVPIAVSVAVSHISGILLLGVAGDVFRYGASVWLINVGAAVMGLLSAFVYLPVFYELKLINIYDYLEKRFDRKTKMLAVVFYLFAEVLMFPIYAYTSSLTFATASGINVNLIAFVLSVVCILYTSIGGFKTVVWTDFLQFGIIMGSLVTIYVTGLTASGGFVSVWKTARAGERLDIFNFDVDPTLRSSFWSYLLGVGATFTAYVSVHQTGVQKFLSLTKAADYKWSVMYSVISMALIHTFGVFIGLLIYDKYKDCDPLTSHMVSKHDQVFPLFVTEIGAKVPGVSGLFMAAICCGSLSTMSSNLNALSGVIYKDVVCFFFKKKANKNGSGVLKMIVLVFGTVCTCLVFTVEHLGEVVAVSVLVIGLMNGPLLGVFTLGMLFPKANKKGAFCGLVGGFIAVACIAIPAKIYEIRGLIKYSTKPLSTSGCDLFNQTLNTTQFSVFNSTFLNESSQQPPAIFRITFYYYTFLGAIMTVIFGVVVSYIVKNNSSVDKKLLSPLIYKHKVDHGEEMIPDATVQEALHFLD